MRLVWSAEALDQLRVARDYIAKDNPHAAGRVVETIRSCCERLMAFPKLGRGETGAVRSIQVGRTRYRLFYRVEGDLIRIVTLHHGAQQWPDIGC